MTGGANWPAVPSPSGGPRSSFTSTGSRLAWMDVLRGVAILLVLVWHASAIPALYGVGLPSWLAFVNDFFLPFRMPTLMFLSGLLLQRSLAKPLGQYYLGKFRLIAWPYLVWALVHITTFNAVAPIYHPRAWIATGYLWFLFYILCYYLIAPALRSVPPVLVVAASFAGAALLPEGRPQRMLYFAIFFFAGWMATRYRKHFDVILSSRLLMLFCALAAVALGVVSGLRDVQYLAILAPVSMCGILVAVRLATAVSSRWSMRAVTFVGRNSIVFYVSHFPIVQATFLLLVALGMTVYPLIGLATLTTAIAGGAILARYRDVVPVRWLFEAPLPTRWLGRGRSHEPARR